MFKDKDYPERKILELADYLYVNSSLKPISKILFLVSRLLLVLSEDDIKEIIPKTTLIKKYNTISKKYGLGKEGSDYNFSEIIEYLDSDYEKIFNSTKEIFELAKLQDSPGMILEALLRGRYEAGEGLGTHLTPEEVVYPIAGICKQIQYERTFENTNILIGDITAGTGRFIEALLTEFTGDPIFKSFKIEYFMADHSIFTLDLARIHFILKKQFKKGVFHLVKDSITDSTIYSYKGKFDILLTNPPFGNNRYHWNEELENNFHPTLLYELGMKKETGSLDPAELFFFKNLDLLKEEGILGIILPDGILYNDKFKKCVSLYESHNSCKVKVRALLSLPPRTFSLGGTIAKTSCLILQKSSASDPGVHAYYGEANHIGFIKKGNFRVSDPEGNDLEEFRSEFMSKQSFKGVWKKPNKFKELTPNFFKKKVRPLSERDKTMLGDIAELVKEPDKHSMGNNVLSFHVSVLDINPLGMIDLYQARKNAPVTRGWICLPGYILISCINPQIWRTTVVPQFIQAKWVCSAEFAVLRIMREDIDPYHVFSSLMESDASGQLVAMSSGTSASRQRVKKEDVLQIQIPLELGRSINIKHFKERRNAMYADLWNEILLLT